MSQELEDLVLETNFTRTFRRISQDLRKACTDNLVKNISAVIYYSDLTLIRYFQYEYKLFWESAIKKELIVRLAPEFVFNIIVCNIPDNEPRFYGRRAKISPHFGLIFSQIKSRAETTNSEIRRNLNNSCYCDTMSSFCRIIHSNAETVVFNDIVNEDYRRATLSGGVFLPFVYNMQISIFPLDFILPPNSQQFRNISTLEHFISYIIRNSTSGGNECIIALIPESKLSQVESQLKRLKGLSNVALWGGEVETRICRKLWLFDPIADICCKEYDFTVVHLKIESMQCCSIVLNEPKERTSTSLLRKHYEQILLDFKKRIQNKLKEHVFGLIFGSAKNTDRKDFYDHQSIIQSVFLSIFQKKATSSNRPSEPIPLVGMFGKGRVIGLSTVGRRPDEKIIHDKSTVLLIISYDVPKNK